MIIWCRGPPCERRSQTKNSGVAMTNLGRPLNYYGSKERLCGRIYALIPPDVENWVDAFCGSAVVTLKKPRHKREVINDLNGDVVNLFAVLRDPAMAADLYARLELTPYAQRVLTEARAARAGDPVERARVFLIRSWFGRGGRDHQLSGFRWSKGQTTAPEITWAKLPARLVAVADRLRGICIRSEDAFKIIDDYDVPETCIFADPPYPGEVGRRYKVKMAEDRHAALAQRLKACKARVILTMNPDTVYGEVLADWRRYDVMVLGGGRQNKPEVILTNFDPPGQGVLPGVMAGGVHD